MICFKKILPATLLFIFFSSMTYAAFPIEKTVPTEQLHSNHITTTKTVAQKTSKHLLFGKKAAYTENAGHQRKGHIQWLAALLGILCGAYGVHRFYLGYIWQGFVQALAYPLLIAGILLITFPPASLALASAVAYGVACLLAAGAIWVWKWIDIVRIISGTLTPANGGSYRGKSSL